MKNRIQDIAPLLAEDFIDFDINREKQIQLATDNSQRLGLLKKYLGLLHDSSIIRSNASNDKFSITLNDFTTHVFADVIVNRQKLKIKHAKLVFPIKIDFEITNLSFNTVDENGYIHSMEQTNFDEYLSEQIISIDKDIIEIGLTVWKDGIKNRPDQNILILISSTNIVLTELQDKAWRELFADTNNDYYNYFKTQLGNGRYLSDRSICNKLIDEFDKIDT